MKGHCGLHRNEVFQTICWGKERKFVGLFIGVGAINVSPNLLRETVK